MNRSTSHGAGSCGLKVAWPSAPSALPARMPPAFALVAPITPVSVGDSVHEPVHDLLRPSADANYATSLSSRAVALVDLVQTYRGSSSGSRLSPRLITADAGITAQDGSAYYAGWLTACRCPRTSSSGCGRRPWHGAAPWLWSCCTSGSRASGRSSHLVFATNAWVRRAILGESSPWDPPYEEMPDEPSVPRDTDAWPPLDKVLALRVDRMATVRRVLAGLTDEALGRPDNACHRAGYPEPESSPVCRRL
jgi:hypothetical protein